MSSSLPGEQQLSAFNRFCELLIEGAEKHGVASVYVFLVFGFMAFLIIRLINISLKTKDKEISRLVDERNKLQDIILKQRKSSQEQKRNKMTSELLIIIFISAPLLTLIIYLLRVNNKTKLDNNR